MTVFFDGLETEPAILRFRCPGCGAEVARDAWELVAGQLPSRISDADVARFGLARFAIGDVVVTRVRRDGPAAYVVPVTCGCGQAHAVAFGFGEVQPMRYVGEWVGVAAG